MIRTKSAILLFVLLTGCGTENPFSRGPDTVDDSTTNPVPGENISFSADVIPALDDCVSCHRSGAGGWTYNAGDEAYSAVLNTVNRNAPTESELLIKATGGGNHGGGRIFSSASSEYEIILRWIEQGALNN
ncbi:MAG: hypothetical protein KTR29_08140 [Rhodothermaceae bacterium]|nr:hypothetical protein [Rhodothermaceae bacterium]